MSITLNMCSVGNDVPPTGEFALQSCDISTTMKGNVSIKTKFVYIQDAKNHREVSLNFNDGILKDVQVLSDEGTPESISRYIPGELIGRTVLRALGGDYKSPRNLLEIGKEINKFIGTVMIVNARPLEFAFDVKDDDGQVFERTAVNFSYRKMSLTDLGVFDRIEDSDDFKKFTDWLDVNFQTASQDVQDHADDEMSKQESIVHDDKSTPSNLGEGKLYTS